MKFDYIDYPHQSVEGKRIYMVDGKYYPSITTVLGRTLPAEKSKILDAWRSRVGNSAADKKMKDAVERGTNVHLMIERQLKGEDPQTDQFPPAHVQAYKGLRLELKNITGIYGQEVVLYSDILGVAGRCDMVGEYKGEPAIIDYKTSGRMKDESEIQDYWLQTAFYATAHNEMFNTDIKKLVIMMSVENRLPLIFRKQIDDELLLKLAERVTTFYGAL